MHQGNCSYLWLLLVNVCIHIRLEMLGACCDGESPENEVKAMTMMDYDDILDSLLSSVAPNNILAHKEPSPTLCLHKVRIDLCCRFVLEL